MPDGTINIKQSTEQINITGGFQFYGTADEMRAVAKQLNKRADEVEIGWCECDPSEIVSKISVRNLK